MHDLQRGLVGQWELLILHDLLRGLVGQSEPLILHDLLQGLVGQSEPLILHDLCGLVGRNAVQSPAQNPSRAFQHYSSFNHCHCDWLRYRCPQNCQLTGLSGLCDIAAHNDYASTDNIKFIAVS